MESLTLVSSTKGGGTSISHLLRFSVRGGLLLPYIVLSNSVGGSCWLMTIVSNTTSISCILLVFNFTDFHFWFFPQEFVSMLDLQPGQVVLDVGCGIGGSAFYMVKVGVSSV